jgi:hypothetical protein
MFPRFHEFYFISISRFFFLGKILQCGTCFTVMFRKIFTKLNRNSHYLENQRFKRSSYINYIKSNQPFKYWKNIIWKVVKCSYKLNYKFFHKFVTKLLFSVGNFNWIHYVTNCNSVVCHHYKKIMFIATWLSSCNLVLSNIF